MIVPVAVKSRVGVLKVAIHPRPGTIGHWDVSLNAKKQLFSISSYIEMFLFQTTFNTIIHEYFLYEIFINRITFLT